MKNIISFSGGRTSAYLVYLMEQKRVNDGWDVEYVFMDTSAEHPKTYDFIRRCVEHFGIELTCLQADFNQPIGEGHTYNIVSIDDLKHDPVNGVYGQMMRKYGVPTIASPWCTSRMKEETHDKYCNDKYGKGNYTTWLGMRADEPRRVKLPNSRGIRYLAELSDFEKVDVLRWWKDMPFDLEIDEHLGNCVFCFKKAHAKIALAARDEPELLKDWKESINTGNARKDLKINKNDLFGEQEIDRKKGVIYRDFNSIDTIIARFEIFGRNEIRDTLKSMKRYESDSCSESCEAFGDPSQIDMFGID